MRAALDLLQASGRITIRAVSSLYETAPMYVTDQPSFLNAAARTETPLAPEALLDLLKQVEIRRGRVARYRYGPREVDLDILLYDDLVLDTARLSIPHRGLAERAFVLVPLAELAPDLLIPGTESTVEAHLPRVPQADALRRVRDGSWYHADSTAG